MLHEPYEVLTPVARVEPSSSGALSGALNIVERVAAALMLVVAGPILIGSALIIACLSRRTPLIAHLRVGQGGKSFWMLKLRTMWGGHSRDFLPTGLIERIAAEPRNGRKDPTDPRVVSTFAAFCRRHSIDELTYFRLIVKTIPALVRGNGAW
jgi:lipopolysaccharide/colanic/teichoic acid biosynthesis glycosyltransferase